MGSPPEFQGPTRLCHPAGTHACIPPTLVVFHPSVRLRLVCRRGSVATPAQFRASTPCGNGGISYAPANRRFDSGRSGGLRGRHGFRPGPNLRCGWCVPVSHQTIVESSAGAHGLLLHLSPRTPPLTYPRIVQAVLSGEMPHGYTTLKSEKQLEENLMGLLRSRTRKACPLPREYGPVNWYSAPLSLNGVPFRFPWTQEFIRKVIRASTSAGPPIDPLYAFKCITFPNHYWKEPLGWPRAKPVGRAPEAFNRQVQYMELAQIPSCIEGAAQTRQRNLQRRVTPFPRRAVWRPQAKMTMSGDMSIVQHDEINSVLGPEARAEWEGHCLELEIASFPKWKRACELWSQPGWVSKRISLAVESRAELERQQAFAPAMLAPIRAMSSNQPIDRPVTLDLPTHVLQPEPVSPPSTQTSPQSSQPQSGEHAAELTPDAVLVQSTAELSLPEDVSDSETVITVISPQRRSSIASEETGVSEDASKNRARRSSAQ